jgi:hypothetical protein
MIIPSVSWPASLPQCPILDAFEEQPQPSDVSFSPEAGPSKIRRRATAKAWICALIFKMTNAQVNTFNLFYETTLEDGALPFTWEHPVTKVTYIWLFKSEEQPKIRRMAANASAVSFVLVRWDSVGVVALDDLLYEDGDDMLFEDSDEILLE